MQTAFLPPPPPRKRANTRAVLTEADKLRLTRATVRRQVSCIEDMREDCERMFQILAAEVGSRRACQLVRGVLPTTRRVVGIPIPTLAPVASRAVKITPHE